MVERIRLKTAIEAHYPNDGVYRCYETYRNEAKKFGQILIENVPVRTIKEKGTWYVDRVDFESAITLYKNKELEFQKKVKLMMEDYQNRIFHPGKIWISDSRYYVNKGDFRTEVCITLKDRDETWFCNNCNKVAETEHNNPECHICSDWNGCGNDCTLSRVFCSNCGKSMQISIR